MSTSWKLEVGEIYKGKGDYWWPRRVTKIEFGHVFYTDPDMASRNTVESFRRWSAGPMTPAERSARADDLVKIERVQETGRGPAIATLLVPVMHRIDARPDTVEEGGRLAMELATWITAKLDAGAHPVAVSRALLMAAVIEMPRSKS